MSHSEQAHREKAAFTPRIMRVIEDCECGNEDLVVRDSLITIMARAANGFVTAKCKICGTAWLVELANGAKRRIRVQ